LTIAIDGVVGNAHPTKKLDRPLIRGAEDFPGSPLLKGGWGGSNLKEFGNNLYINTIVLK